MAVQSKAARKLLQRTDGRGAGRDRDGWGGRRALTGRGFAIATIGEVCMGRRGMFDIVKCSFSLSKTRREGWRSKGEGGPDKGAPHRSESSKIRDNARAIRQMAQSRPKAENKGLFSWKFPSESGPGK